MRKQTKIAAITSAAALLAIGASMSAFAAGWTQQAGGYYVYLDKDGYPVEGWHRWPADGEYYCTNEDGITIGNAFIDKDGVVDNIEGTVYYVGTDGKRMSDTWIEIPNEDEVSFGEVIPENLYRYVDGKKVVLPASDAEYVVKNIYRTSEKVDKGYFVFDSQGYMLEGSVDDGKYYCVTADDIADNVIEIEGGYVADKYVEGEALMGWVRFPNPDAGLDEQAKWCYFTKDGLTTGAASLDWLGQGKKTYYFGNDGYLVSDDGINKEYTVPATMSDGQKEVGVTFSTLISDGNVATSTGWYRHDHDNVTDWYYIVSVRDVNRKQKTNVIFNGEAGNENMRALKINGKTYIFDKTGKMLDGEVPIDSTFTSDDWYGFRCAALPTGKTFYFNNVAESGHRGELQTGKITWTDENDEEHTRYYDPEEGLVTSAIIRGYVYDEKGDLYVALDEAREIYEPATALTVYNSANSKKLGTAETEKVTKVVVRTNGAAIKNSSKTTVEDDEYKVVNYQATEL